MSVTIKKISFPQEPFLAMSPEERYTYIMLGHMFNELMTLQKLLGISLPKDEHDDEFIRQPIFSQSMFIWKLAAGRLHEAQLTLNSFPMSPILNEKYIPLLSNGRERWKEVQKMHKSLKWIADIRNSTAFHYPKFTQCENLFEDDNFLNLSVYGDDQTGNTYHHGAEQIMQQMLFKSVLNGEDTDKTLDDVHQLIGDLFRYLGLFNRLIEDLLAEYAVLIFKNEIVVISEGKKIDVPRYSEISLPFYMDLSDPT